MDKAGEGLPYVRSYIKQAVCFELQCTNSVFKKERERERETETETETETEKQRDRERGRTDQITPFVEFTKVEREEKS